MKFTHACCAFALVGSVWATNARAADPPAAPYVVVDAPECGSGFARAEFVRLLRIELLDRFELSTASADLLRADASVSVGRSICLPDAREVDVAMRVRGSGADVARRVPLAGSTADARPRVLALAVAEIVREGHAAPPEPDVRPVASTASRDAPPVAESARASAGPSVAAFGEARVFSSPSSLFGARLAGELPFGARLRGRLDGVGFWKRVAEPEAEIAISVYGGGLALLVTVLEDPALLLGPRFELASLSASVPVHDPRLIATSISRPMPSASVLATLRGRLGTHWAVVGELEAGYVLNPMAIVILPRAVEKFSGVVASARVGIAFE
jgi:hypothetical protein